MHLLRESIALCEHPVNPALQDSWNAEPVHGELQQTDQNKPHGLPRRDVEPFPEQYLKDDQIGFSKLSLFFDEISRKLSSLPGQLGLLGI